MRRSRFIELPFTGCWLRGIRNPTGQMAAILLVSTVLGLQVWLAPKRTRRNVPT